MLGREGEELAQCGRNESSGGISKRGLEDYFMHWFILCLLPETGVGEERVLKLALLAEHREWWETWAEI